MTSLGKVTAVAGTAGTTMATSSVINTTLITGLINDIVTILPSLVNLIVAVLPIIIVGIFVYLLRDTIKGITASIGGALRGSSR